MVTKMVHQMAGMAGMEYPAKGLRKVVRRIDDTRDGLEDNITSLAPVLNGKVLDVNMARALGRFSGVYHFDRRFVILVEGCR